MISKTWEQHSVSLTDLRREAENLEPWAHGVYAFLQNVGVVPWSVQTMPKTQVRFDIDASSVPAGYLASAAYEWDTWGPSQPTDFIEAIAVELDPVRRDFTASLLTALGRTVVEV